MDARWRVDFSSWQALDPARRRQLVFLIGENEGEWWGAGRAEFPDHHKALTFARTACEAVGVSLQRIIAVAA